MELIHGKEDLMLQERHCEQADDEFFLGNFNVITDDDPHMQWIVTHLPSRRFGVCAYDKEGNVITGLKPVFAKTSDLQS